MGDVVFQVSPYSAYLHDAVLLYAMGLKEVLKDGKDPHDGGELLQRLKNKNNIHFYGSFNSASIHSWLDKKTPAGLCLDSGMFIVPVK